jgi:hypothetical protein
MPGPPRQKVGVERATRGLERSAYLSSVRSASRWDLIARLPAPIGLTGWQSESRRSNRSPEPGDAAGVGHNIVSVTRFQLLGRPALAVGLDVMLCQSTMPGYRYQREASTTARL